MNGSDREERLAMALRDNLKKRKRQERARVTSKTANIPGAEQDKKLTVQTDNAGTAEKKK